MNPAAPPAPPAELPAALIFPVPSIDVSKTTSASASGSLAAFVAPGGRFSEEIVQGSDLATQGDAILGVFLNPLTDLKIPVDPSFSTFEGPVTFTNHVGETVALNAKIDFSDFDLDGDGVAEGCSGSTSPLPTGATAPRPVCYRIWVETEEGAQRLMAGVFNQLSLGTNIGAGRYVVNTSALPTLFGGLSLSAMYDHRDPLKKATDLFLGYPGMTGFALFAHIFITQQGPDESAIKTLIMSNTFVEDPPLMDSFRSVGRFKEGADFWSGTIQAKGAFTQEGLVESIADVCAQISTGNEVSRLDCVDLGIDVFGVTFVDFATENDVSLPSSANFPDLPIF